MTLSVAGETLGMQEDETAEKSSAGAVSSPDQRIHSASSSTFIEPVKLATVQKKVIRLRPSNIFLAINPLPVAPRSPQPSSSRDTQETVAASRNPTKPGGYEKLASSTGTEKEPLFPLSEQQQNSITTSLSGSKFSKGKEVDGAAVKDEKLLPALPPSRSSSQSRHGIALPSRSRWAPSIIIATASRQSSTTIVEEKEPSSEKKEQKIIRQKPNMNQQHVYTTTKLVTATGILNASTPELATKENRVTTATPAGPKSTTPFGVKRNITNTAATSIVTAAATTNNTTITTTSTSSRKPELPKTWEHHPLGTPSFEKALDEVVRKLEAMEVGKQRAPLGSLSAGENKKRFYSSGSNKPPSPTQRLQKAAAMRRERIDAESEQLDPLAKPSQPTPQPEKQQYLPCMVMPPPGGFRPRDREASRQNMVPRRGWSRMGGMAMEDGRDISDRDVLKGLKIICAASADAGI